MHGKKPCGGGSALQGQSDWEKPLVGVLTQKLCPLLALADLLETSALPSLVALGSTRSPPYHQADEPKELHTSTKFSLKRLRT